MLGPFCPKMTRRKRTFPSAAWLAGRVLAVQPVVQTAVQTAVHTQRAVGQGAVNLIVRLCRASRVDARECIGHKFSLSQRRAWA